MSTAVYPSLPGLGFSVKKTPPFKSRIQQSISGKEARISDWTTPRYTYELTYEILREHGSFAELKTLMAFWLARQGSFDTFLFDDPDDNSVTAQGIATGDGSTTQFQLARTIGGGGFAWTDPIYAPNSVSAVYLNGSPFVGCSVGTWGTSSPGVLFFPSAPSSGVVITVDMTYYWPVRFTDDTQELEKFLDKMWTAKAVKFISVK